MKPSLQLRLKRVGFRVSQDVMRRWTEAERSEVENWLRLRGDRWYMARGRLPEVPAVLRPDRDLTG